MMKQQRGAVRAVLNMSLFVLLLLSGLLCSSSGQREYNYIYVNQSMTWTEAQSYCRENYIDLATVDSIDDVNMMMNTVNDGYSGSVWIGLKRATPGLWGWSNGENTISLYHSWYIGQPDGQSINEFCVFTWAGFWHDMPCNNLLNFLCYTEPNIYSIAGGAKNWTDAQSYCRQYHTDLITIHSSMEQNIVNAITGSTEMIWIGLSYDYWQWSDQWSLFYRNWGAGYTSQSSGSGYCVAMSTASGKWIQSLCTDQRHFICYRDLKKQIVRLNFSLDGNYNLNDPLLQTAILNKIGDKLRSAGLKSHNTISWRKDEVGEVFHQQIKPTVNSNYECGTSVK